MDFRRRAVIALAVVAIVLLSATPMVKADADDRPDLYGTTTGINMEEIDEFCKELFGMTFKELMTGLIKDITGHDVTYNPNLDSKVALSRTITDDGDLKAISDRVSGYLILINYIDSEGMYPAPGTYFPKEGESQADFIKRVLTQESMEQHSISISVALALSLDFQVDTFIDKDTGEIVDVYVSISPMISIEYEGNFVMDMSVDDEGTIQSMTVGYDKSKAENNMYADLEIDLAVDGLKVIGEGSWSAHPTITESVKKAIVSSDMVGGVWDIIKSMMTEKIDIPVLDLILEILGSTDKKLDLFKTIESLTGNPIPDITFVADANISDITDEKGDRYVVIDIQRDGGSTRLELPLAGYRADTTSILDLIPDSILSKEAKTVIKIALGILGWDRFDVVSINDDPETQNEIAEIQKIVDTFDAWNEEYEFKLPLEYLITAIAVAVIGIVAFALMWRGRA